MTIFIRPNRYEFQCEGHARYEERAKIVAEFSLTAYGEAQAKFWIERTHPNHYDDQTEEWVDEWTEEIQGETLSTRDIVDDVSRGMDEPEMVEMMLIRTLIIALGRGEVIGESASDLAWNVFWHIKQKSPKWLREGAPEWWKMMSR